MTEIDAPTKRNNTAASLAFFRILFGILILTSALRFMLNGWVERYFIEPKVFFPYWGFHWVHPLPGQWMYLPFIGMGIAAVFIILGWHFRGAMFAFLLLFTYTEVIDITNYLNHHYLIFLLSVLMAFMPMSADYSLDARRKGIALGTATVAPQYLHLLRLQIGLVYFFAGIAKLKYSWLIDAQPMKIWMGASSGLPFVGKLLGMEFTAYLFSWAGMLFDMFVPFLLSIKRTRLISYVLIIVFHSLTKFLFYIGLFPLIMTSLALIFFSAEWHKKILDFLVGNKKQASVLVSDEVDLFWKKIRPLMCCFFAFQLLMPFRYLLYKGDVMWTEQGFRYSWNVMLMEKNGYVEFYLKDKNTGREQLIIADKYLSRQQIKMMSTQPDMILQLAHFLADEHKSKTGNEAAVRAEAHASLNGRGSKLLIDPTIDLAAQQDNLCEKNWITSL